MKKVELLSPASSLESIRVAFAFGSDAVYCGIPLFSLRAKENDFTIRELKQAVDLVSKAKKKIYFTLNTYPRDSEFKKLESFLKQIKKHPPHAFIVSDLGVMSVVKKFFPRIPLHLSVQANSVNSQAIREWGKLGIKRVILARELSLREIQSIIRANPKMEFETFIHGSICMSYSGRCLLSMYLSGRDANRGKCNQPCRWKYKLGSRFQGLGSSRFTLEEEFREGEYFPIEEDKQGSYILNSRDLCLIEKIPALIKAGVISFKIEGRNKTIGYLATITRAYRQAIDDFEKKKAFDKKLWKEIRSVGNRDFTLGFFDGSLKNLQNYERSGGENPQIFLGLVEKSSRGKILFEPKNRFDTGDKIELVIPRGEVVSARVEGIEGEKGEKLSKAHGGQRDKVWVKLNLTKEFPIYTLIRKCNPR